LISPHLRIHQAGEVIVVPVAEEINFELSHSLQDQFLSKAVIWFRKESHQKSTTIRAANQDLGLLRGQGLALLAQGVGLCQRHHSYNDGEKARIVRGELAPP